MVPPPGETWRVVVVERERRVAGDVLLRKGHIERDCLSKASIMKFWMYDVGGRVSVFAIDGWI